MVSLRALCERSPTSRREVLVPSFTFAAVVDAIVWCGLQPVFADVEAETWHLDPEQVELAIETRGEQLAAVLACSTFGTAPPLAVQQRWESACAVAGIPLLVDSASGFGALDESGRLLGRQGDAEVFSFHATKPFAIGEGGAVVTEDADLAVEMRSLLNFGLDEHRTPRRRHGINAKMSEIHAATGLAVLDGYDQTLDRRRMLAERIRVPLERAGFSFQPGAERSTWQFVPTLAPSPQARAAVLAVAASSGVEVRTYFDPPLSNSRPFSSSQRMHSLGVTDELSQRILSLPLANDLTDSQVERIVACGLAAVREAAV